MLDECYRDNLPVRYLSAGSVMCARNCRILRCCWSCFYTRSRVNALAVAQINQSFLRNLKMHTRNVIEQELE